VMTHQDPPRAQGSATRKGRVPVAEAVVLMLLWLVLSGWWDPFHSILGLATVLFVLWINRSLRAAPLTPSALGDEPPIRLWRLALYLPWLLGQMLSSGLYVAYLALRPGSAIAPLILRFHSGQPSVSAQVVLGNSITLTPGTLTLEVEDGELVVHALSDRTAEGFLRGSMPARVARLYGGGSEPLITGVRRFRSRRELPRA
jgi:multicomponent Na+:H+ antiporter subunit E